MIRYIKNRLWLIRRLLLLKIRGRVHHSDRFGLSYWLWDNTRAMGTPSGEPRTDDTGVLEQLRRVYEAIGQPDGRQVVSVDAGTYIGVTSLAMFRFGPVNHVVHSFEADDINYSGWIRTFQVCRVGRSLFTKLRYRITLEQQSSQETGIPGQIV